MTYRAGIIGCGRIGVEFEDCHANAYLDCPDTELAAVCDIIRDRVPVAFPHGVLPGSYDNYLLMVKWEKLDIVSVCTPVETHCQIVCDIAPYVKAIYCEKPMATTIEECDRMIEVCHRHNVILQINHQRRFSHPDFAFNNRTTTLTHVFDLIRQYNFKDVMLIPIDTDESIFKFSLYRQDERMILGGVNHLVSCLKNGHQSISSGEEGRETLRMVLEYERNKRNP